LAVAVAALGWALLAAPRNTPARCSLLLWHRSLGLVVLLVTLFCLLWRRRHPPPPLPPGVAPFAAGLARATQAALYAVLVVMPVTGYVDAAAAGHEVSLFGLVSLPPLLPESGRLAQVAIAIHLAGQYLAYACVALHLAGVLYHATLARDGVVERMLPRLN
jgi:cytochrome b561